MKNDCSLLSQATKFPLLFYNLSTQTHIWLSHKCIPTQHALHYFSLTTKEKGIATPPSSLCFSKQKGRKSIQRVLHSEILLTLCGKKSLLRQFWTVLPIVLHLSGDTEWKALKSRVIKVLWEKLRQNLWGRSGRAGRDLRDTLCYLWGTGPGGKWGSSPLWLSTVKGCCLHICDWQKRNGWEEEFQEEIQERSNV